MKPRQQDLPRVAGSLLVMLVFRTWRAMHKPLLEVSPEPEGLDRSGESGRLVTAAGIVEEVAGKRRTPVFQHLHKAASAEQVLQGFLHRCADANPVKHRLDDKVGIVERGWPLWADAERFASFLKLPSVKIIGIGFVPFSQLGKGLLTGKMSPDTKFDYTDFRGTLPKFSPENMKNNYAVVKMVMDFAGRKQSTPAQVALAWLLARKPWIVFDPGTTKLDRLEENLGATGLSLCEAEIRELDEASAKVKLQGDRYSPVHQQLVGR